MTAIIRTLFLMLAVALVCWRWVPTPTTSLSAAQAGSRSWYKGNLHTHSLWSDGNDFPEMIADWYHARGYHFLALSDHNILSKGEKWIDSQAGEKRGAVGGVERYRQRFGDDWVVSRQQGERTEIRLRALDEFRAKFEQPEMFLFIQAEEITDKFGTLPIHINAHNVREIIRPQGGASVREVMNNNLAAVEAHSLSTGQPMLAHLNHPNFGWGVTAEDLAFVVAERFFEVYNGHPGVNHRGDEQRPGTERIWDIANALRLWTLQAAPLYGVATDDSHQYFGLRGSSPGRGWVMVRAEQLSPESLIASLKQGDFYASSGVTLDDLRFDARDRTLRIDVAAERGVSYTIDFIASTPPRATGTLAEFDRDAAWIGRVVASQSGPSATYVLREDDLYVRAVITSNRTPANPAMPGQYEQAWTQPVGWESRVARP